MAKIEVSGVADLGGTFEPLPVGTYPARVTKCDVAMSKAKKPMLSWNFTITGGEYEKRILFHNTSLQPQAAWRLNQELNGLGVAHEVVGEKPNITISFDTDDCLDRECKISVGQQFGNKVDAEGKKNIMNTVEEILPF